MSCEFRSTLDTCLYRYNVNIVCVQPWFVIPLNLGLLILNSFQVYSMYRSDTTRTGCSLYKK